MLWNSGFNRYSDLTSVEIIRRNNISEGGGKMKTTLNLEGLFTVLMIPKY